MPSVWSGVILAATRNLAPGEILRITQQGDQSVFKRKADANFQNLTSVATAAAIPTPPVGGIGTLQPGAMAEFFCNGINESHVLIASAGGGRPVYTHSTYVRDVAAENGNLYFSEASGAGHDGAIYRFRDASYTAVDLFCHVRIADIGGFWSGNFAFGADRTVYVANGNERPACIWKFPSPTAKPERIFEHADMIGGFCVVDTDTILFTQWTNTIFELHVAAQKVDILHQSPKPGTQYSDVTWQLPTL